MLHYKECLVNYVTGTLYTTDFFFCKPKHLITTQLVKLFIGQNTKIMTGTQNTVCQYTCLVNILKTHFALKILIHFAAILIWNIQVSRVIVQ